MCKYIVAESQFMFEL